MRIAVVGKGGAGKSVIAGTMARLVARKGTPVLALDSDLFPGLSLSLGSGPDPVEPPLLGAAEQDETGQLVEDWAPYADIHLVIVQPSAQSALTAQRVASLARQQTPQAAVVFIANRVQREQDVRRVEELVGEPVFASLPADEGVAAAERIGAGLSNLRQTADEPLEH